jgi:CheY-like chemotaxis protein
MRSRREWQAGRKNRDHDFQFPQRRKSMDSTHMAVLLASNNARRSATLQRWLSDRGCHCQFATSFEGACRLLSQTEFDLVLCQYELPDRTAFPLLDWLDGSRSTLLVSAKSKRGPRWLPLIERGQRCLDWPLLRTTDLPGVLTVMLDSPRQNAATPTAARSASPELVNAG